MARGGSYLHCDPPVAWLRQQLRTTPWRNSYGWWQIGQYAFYAAIGLTVAAVVVFLAFLFEIARWRVSRKEERVAGMTRRPTAGTRAA